MLGPSSTLMSLGDRQVRISCHVRLRPQAVPDPTDAQLSNLFDAFDRSDNGGCLVNQGRVDGVHRASTNLPHRRTENPEDSDGDAQTNESYLVRVDRNRGMFLMPWAVVTAILCV